MSAESDYEPAVSAVVPVLNAETTVKDLLESLVEVDYDETKLEMIFVDGGSSDKTRDIIQTFPVKLILENRKGLNVARNTGVRNSRGEIVLFTDSDCVVPRDWVTNMVRNFGDLEVGCVGGSVSRYEDSFLSRYADKSIMPVLRKFARREILDNVKAPLGYPAGCNMGFRRSALEEVNGFDENIVFGFDEDELVERVCDAGYRMVLDPETIVRHQHRAALRSLLKQTFNYGRGGAVLFRRKGSKGRLSKWNLMSLVLFLGWSAASSSLSFLSVTANPAFLIPLALVSLVPFAMLVFFYSIKAIAERDYAIAIAYPFIDILRAMAYCAGEIYGTLTIASKRRQQELRQIAVGFPARSAGGSR